jgi:hypothetical protein
MPPRVLIALLAALAALALAACGEKEEPSARELADATEEEQAEEEFEIAGDWRGQLQQQGLDPFVVTAKITGAEGPNTVHYTGIDCSGDWTYEGRTGDSYSFNERIDRGKSDKCKGSGTVTLSVESADELGYEFRGGGVESRGTLERVG